MSRDALKAYMDHLGQNETAARDLVERINQAEEGQAALEAAAAHARGLGFEVTAEDADALRQAVLAESGELSDEQLEDVAGGGIALGVAAVLAVTVFPALLCGGVALGSTPEGQKVLGPVADFVSKW